MIFIGLEGRIPSKKNSKQIVCKGPNRLVLPSKQYTIWHKDAMLQLEEQEVPKSMIDEQCYIDVFFYAPDKRKFDLSNKFESIADLLVDYGYLADDNYTILQDVKMKFVEIDRENPRVEVYIGTKKE